VPADTQHDRECHEVIINFYCRIAIDPIFPPPEASKWTGGKSYKIPESILEANRFELIFDELVDGKNIKIN
jgi:hypothetical protein